MNENVDLQQLAIDRGEAVRSSRRGRRVLTRYLFPMALLFGFIALVAWELRDVVFPARDVTVIPVHATRAVAREQGAVVFKAAGWVEPRPTPIRVAALARGVVDQLLVVEDQEVEAGEPVAELVKDDSNLSYDRAIADVALREAELEEANAALAAAKTRLDQPAHLHAAIGEANAALAKIETQLKNLPFATRRAEADLATAQKDYDGKVAAEGVVAGVEIERAKNVLDSAKSSVEELRARVDSLAYEKDALIQRRDAFDLQLKLLADEKQAKEEAQAKVKAAKARLAQSQVTVAEAQLRKDRMTVRAPVDGRVYQLMAEPGATLTGGSGRSQQSDGSTVVTLYRPQWLQVRVDVRFQDIPQVNLGQMVRIENAALPEPLQGVVLFVGSEADIQKNTLPVKVEILQPPSVLKPEMLVDVTFIGSAKAGSEAGENGKTRFFVPESLVDRDGDQHVVWVADQLSGTARRTIVEKGQVDSRGFVEIIRGLSISDRIIARGRGGLQDGDRIRIVGEEPAPEDGGQKD